MNEITMVVKCMNCRGQENLQMFAHRNVFDEIVGWLFLCITCAEQWNDGGWNLHLYLKNEDGKEVEWPYPKHKKKQILVVKKKGE